MCVESTFLPVAILYFDRLRQSVLLSYYLLQDEGKKAILVTVNQTVCL